MGKAKLPITVNIVLTRYAAAQAGKILDFLGGTFPDNLRMATFRVPEIKGEALENKDKMCGPEEAIRALYHDPKIVETLLALPVTPELVDMQLKNRHTTARLAWEPRFHDPHLPKWLHRIDVPVKIVWGEQDRIIPVKFVDVYRKHFPKAQIHIVKGCGHLPHVRDAVRVNLALAEFLGRR